VYTFFVKINTRRRISDKDDVSEFVGRIRKRRREVILAGSDERTFYKIINSVISLKSLMLLSFCLSLCTKIFQSVYHVYNLRLRQCMSEKHACTLIRSSINMFCITLKMPIHSVYNELFNIIEE